MQFIQGSGLMYVRKIYLSKRLNKIAKTVLCAINLIFRRSFCFIRKEEEKKLFTFNTLLVIAKQRGANVKSVSAHNSICGYEILLLFIPFSLSFFLLFTLTLRESSTSTLASILYCRFEYICIHRPNILRKTLQYQMWY